MFYNVTVFNYSFGQINAAFVVSIRDFSLRALKNLISSKFLNCNVVYNSCGLLLWIFYVVFIFILFYDFSL